MRIIYDYNVSKCIYQYNNIINLFPPHELIVYKGTNTTLYNKSISDYNIYFDIISKKFYLNYPAKYTILIVNDEYISTTLYLREEEYTYKNKLIKIKKVVDYYFCLTNYSYYYLYIIKKIDKSKLVLLSGFCISTSYTLIKNNKTYIYYEIDKYSKQQNIIILKTWVTHFINRPEILLVKFIYNKEYICEVFSKYMTGEDKYMNNNNKKYTYKNIIFFVNSNFLKEYENNIVVSIINTSYFNLINKLYENILKKRIIITCENIIQDEQLNNLNKKFILKSFTEKNLVVALNNYFNIKEKECLDIINTNI
jgi:hypothetical protein